MESESLQHLKVLHGLSWKRVPPLARAWDTEIGITDLDTDRLNTFRISRYSSTLFVELMPAPISMFRQFTPHLVLRDLMDRVWLVFHLFGHHRPSIIVCFDRFSPFRNMPATDEEEGEDEETANRSADTDASFSAGRKARRGSIRRCWAGRCKAARGGTRFTLGGRCGGWAGWYRTDQIGGLKADLHTECIDITPNVLRFDGGDWDKRWVHDCHSDWCLAGDARAAAVEIARRGTGEMRWTTCRDCFCDGVRRVGCDAGSGVAWRAGGGRIVCCWCIGPARWVAARGHRTHELVVAIAVRIWEAIGRRGEGGQGGRSGHLILGPDVRPPWMMQRCVVWTWQLHCSSQVMAMIPASPAKGPGSGWGLDFEIAGVTGRCAARGAEKFPSRISRLRQGRNPVRAQLVALRVIRVIRVSSVISSPNQTRLWVL